jgi:hypothetical protein
MADEMMSEDGFRYAASSSSSSAQLRSYEEDRKFITQIDAVQFRIEKGFVPGMVRHPLMRPPLALRRFPSLSGPAGSTILL